MREADDVAFGAYAAARWTPLVRVASLLGTPAHLAPVVVRNALARTRTAWAGRDPIDPDLLSCQALLEERRLGDTWWVSRARRALPEDAGRDALESRLDRLSVDQRAGVLFAALLGLDAGYVGAGASGVHTSDSPGAEEIRAVAERIQVEPLETASVAEVAGEQARRRRRVTWSALVTVTTVLALAVGASLVSGPGSGEEPGSTAIDPSIDDSITAGPRATVVVANNPAPVPWYAQGSLRLAQATLEIPTVRRAAQLGNSGVVLTYAGQLSLIDDLGKATRLADLGQLGNATSFVVSNQDSLVAWVEPEPDPDPVEQRPVTLVVRDTTRRIDLLRMLVDPGTVPVAVDSRAVFFNQDDQSVRIALGNEEYVEVPRQQDVQIDPRQIVAANGPTRIYQVAEGRLEVEHALLARGLELDGSDGELSDDGRYFTTRTYEEDATVYGTVHVYELPGGVELDSGIDPASTVAIDVELGPEDTISYLLAGIGPGGGGLVPGEEGSERLDLVSCNLSDRYLRFAISAGEERPDRCSVQARIPTSGVATFLGQ